MVASSLFISVAALYSMVATISVTNTEPVDHDRALVGSLWPSPDLGCYQGNCYITDSGGPIVYFVPVWAKDGPIKCNDYGFFVNGKSISSEQVSSLAIDALNKNRERVNQLRNGLGNSGVGSYDENKGVMR